MNIILRLFRSSGLTIPILGIWLLALSLRFWGLSRFNTLVFDEVYYAKYAVNYLNGTEFFDAHPPLGKYCISIGIWLSQFFPLNSSVTTDVAGQNLNPFSYRWLNAFIGSFVPLLISGIAYQISHRRSYALISGFLATLEGLWLVESRYALINVYMVFFGLLGQWLFLVGIDRHGKWRVRSFILSGISLGATISVKWNGLGFIGSLYILWGLGWLVRWMTMKAKNRNREETKVERSLLFKFTKVSAFQVFLYLVFLPIIIYILFWIPHLHINSNSTFLGIHHQILSYHQGLGTGKDVHPYCSAWWSWPLLLRSIGYFYAKSGGDKDAILPVNLTPENPIVYDVHLLGNPILFWLSSTAILISLLLLIEWMFKWISSRFAPSSSIGSNRQFLRQSSELEILLYLVVNYAVNYLPWAKVSRCTFLYLYMGALVFAVLAIAWSIDRWLRSSSWVYQIVGGLTIFTIVLSFLFWLPIYLGLPLDPESFQLRMLFKSWI
ncbi:MAG: phospholipid carrier-dependent glycosyltransferase [Geitlerinemataceae cyanobacterium]